MRRAASGCPRVRTWPPQLVMEAGLAEDYERRWYVGCPLEVRPVPNKGRGLFATKAVRKGEILLQSIPYAWAVYESYKQTTCRYCLRDRAEGAAPYEHMCTRCKDTWYCSAKCQQLDEGVHLAEECRVMQEWELDPKSYTPDTISEMKFLLRVLSCKAYERSIGATPQPGVLLYEDYARLVARVSDFDEHTIDALRFWIADYLSKLRKWMGCTEEAAELMDILVRNRRNSFYVASCHSGKPPVACALYVNPSFFNHSCSPNVTYQTTPEQHKPRIFVYLADADLPKDSELCITYLDETSIVKDVTERRRLLHESFRFTCGCARCVHEEADTQARKADPAYAAFIDAHLVQLKAVDFPPVLYAALYKKLHEEVFDAGRAFEFLPADERVSAMSDLCVYTKGPLKANSDVFLIDHAWTTTIASARTQLRTQEGCLRRVEQLLGLNKEEAEDDDEADDPEKLPDAEVSLADRIQQAVASGESNKSIDLDTGSFTGIPAAEILKAQPHVERLSLCSHRIADLAALVAQLRQFTHLKALWLSGNPVCDAKGYAEAVLEACPLLEIHDSKFTSRYGAWAIAYATKSTEIDLTDRNIKAVKPELLTPAAVPKLRTLDVRRNAFGNVLSDLLTPLKGAVQLRSLWLERGSIPRAEIFAALPHLEEVNGAAADEEKDYDREIEARVQAVYNTMWLRNQCYKIGSANGTERAEVCADLMDELGARLSHGDVPNFAVHPLYVVDKLSSFSIAWPIRDIGEREAVSRDFLPGCARGPEREARLAMWFPQRRNAALYSQLNNARYVQLGNVSKDHDKLAQERKFAALLAPMAAIATSKMKVFCDIQLVREAFARRPEFELVTDDSTAAVVWLYEQIADFGSLRPSVYVNQIPDEECITLKDLLQHTIHRKIGQPKWFLPSYNLRTELLHFLGEYSRRAEAGEHNTWIVKPWNLARGIGHVISADQACILRQLETGPRVASLYVPNPLLYNRRKIDFRYMVLVKSGPHPEAYVYKTFITRIAPQEYKSSSFEEYARHFTVMTFTDLPLLEVKQDEFLRKFEADHPDRWPLVQQKVYELLSDLLSAAFAKEGGLVKDTHYFGVYGVDILLDSDFNVHLLEVNFSPNMERFQRYYNFLDQLLSLLFLSNDKDNAFERVM